MSTTKESVKSSSESIKPATTSSSATAESVKVVEPSPHTTTNNTTTTKTSTTTPTPTPVNISTSTGINILKESGTPTSIPATVIRVHYKTNHGDDVSIFGHGEGLSWNHGVTAELEYGVGEGDGECIWVVRLPIVDATGVVVFKPQLNHHWSKGHDYTTRVGTTLDIYPFFYSNEGTYFKRFFYSRILKNKRRIVIYLPPSYDENPYKHYPIMFMMDGHNLFDTEHSFCEKTWRLKPTLDSICCTNIIEPIIVGVYPIERGNEYLPIYAEEYNEGGQADKYLDFLLKELKPYVQRYLRTTSSIGISGSSWGGVISFYAWMSRPEDFDICGSFSPSMKFHDRYLFPIAEKTVRARKDHQKMYMDYGTVHDEGKATRDMFAFLKKMDVYKPHQINFPVFEGHSHNEDFWAMRSPQAFSWMYADPNRVSVVHSD